MQYNSSRDQTWLISNYRTVCQATVASWTPVLAFRMLAPRVGKEYHTSRFCRRKANTVSTSAVRAATISLLRGGESPSGKVWISSVRRRKISRPSSTWVGCWGREKGEGRRSRWRDENKVKGLKEREKRWKEKGTERWREGRKMTVKLEYSHLQSHTCTHPIVCECIHVREEGLPVLRPHPLGCLHSNPR